MKNETGATLIETLVALTLLGIVGVAFLSGLATASKASIVANDRSTAESLARSQMEWVKEVDYVYEATGYPTAPISSEEDYTGYSAQIDAEPLNSPDEGIQKITVTIKHHDEEVLSFEAYKVDR